MDMDRPISADSVPPLGLTNAKVSAGPAPYSTVPRGQGGGLDPSEFPAASQVGSGIPPRRSLANVLASPSRLQPMHITQRDRDELIGLATITARKRSRIVGIVAPGPFLVETDRGQMAGVAGDLIVTNHPDDDATSDVWSISRERYDATYEPDDGEPALIETTSVSTLLRAARDRLRVESGSRDAADRHRSIAITKLEEALLWLNGQETL
jgi:hypothetical protein